jgi:pyruvate ferredoxin oxidoreductase alpha subunit
MVGPDAFMEVRYLAHYKHLRALKLIPELAESFAAKFGRESGGLIHEYRTEDAETIIVAMGSVIGTIKDVVDEMRDAGQKIGCLAITSFRPFPLVSVATALHPATRVVVVEKNLSVGLGGLLASNVRMALRGALMPVHTVIAGLGGRTISSAALREVFEQAQKGEVEDVTFLSLNWEVVGRELIRMSEVRRSGPTAENILRETQTPGGAY